MKGTAPPLVQATRTPLAATLVLLAMSGCMVGPNYARPPAPTASAWSETDRPNVQSELTDHWWDVFHDPILSRLVDLSYAQNLTLRVAGLRVIEVQARRAIAIGTF